MRPAEFSPHDVAVALPIRVVDRAGAARMLGIGLSTLYQLVKRGELHPVYITEDAGFRVDEIDALVERKTKRTSGESE